MWSKWVKSIFVAAVMFCAVTLFSTEALAAPANSKLQEYKQPNGVKFSASLHGDEWFNWLEAKSGEVLAKGNDGYFYYGELVNGRVQPTQAKFLINQKPQNALLKKDMESLAKSNSKDSLLPKYENILTQPQITSNMIKNKLENNSKKMLDKKTTEPMLIILVNYQDISIKYPVSAYKDLFFNTAKASVDRFYSDVSNGMFQFAPVPENQGTANDGIVTVTLPFKHPNTAGGYDGDYVATWSIVKGALQQTDNYIDFSKYDTNQNGTVERSELHTVFVSAGWEYAAGGATGPSLWAHSWTMQDDGETDYRAKLDGVYVCSLGEGTDENGEEVTYNGGYTIQGEQHQDHMMTMGTVTHELCHDCGAPDEYDYGYDSAGVGIHSLMADGSWAAAPGGFGGSSPTYMDGFTRWLLGFADTKVIEAKGNYSVRAISSSAKQPDLLLVPSAKIIEGLNMPSEFFLVENRQYKGFDASLKSYTKSGGILIEHVDLLKYLISEITGDRMNDDQNHKSVDVEEANEGRLGYSQLDNNVTKDVTLYDHYYYAGGNTAFNSKTLPNSKLYDGTLCADLAITSKSADVMTVNVQSVVDFVPPTIKSISPVLKLTPGGQTANYIEIPKVFTKVDIKFSEAIFPYNNSANNDYGNLGWVYLTDTTHKIVMPSEVIIKGDTLTVQFQQPLTPGYSYRLRLAGECLQDAFGNVFPMQAVQNGAYPVYDYFFKIKDTAGPAVIDSTIVNNGTDVSVSDPLLFLFDEPIGAKSDFSKITLKDSTGKSVKLLAGLINGYNNILAVFPVDSNGNVVRLEYNKKYTLSIPAGAIVDGLGNKCKAITYTFTTQAAALNATISNNTLILKDNYGTEYTVDLTNIKDNLVIFAKKK